MLKYSHEKSVTGNSLYENEYNLITPQHWHYITIKVEKSVLGSRVPDVYLTSGITAQQCT